MPSTPRPNMADLRMYSKGSIDHQDAWLDGYIAGLMEAFERLGEISEDVKLNCGISCGCAVAVDIDAICTKLSEAMGLSPKAWQDAQKAFAKGAAK